MSMVEVLELGCVLRRISILRMSLAGQAVGIRAHSIILYITYITVLFLIFRSFFPHIAERYLREEYYGLVYTECQDSSTSVGWDGYGHNAQG